MPRRAGEADSVPGEGRPTEQAAHLRAARRQRRGAGGSLLRVHGGGPTLTLTLTLARARAQTLTPTLARTLSLTPSLTLTLARTLSLTPSLGIHTSVGRDSVACEINGRPAPLIQVWVRASVRLG